MMASTAAVRIFVRPGKTDFRNSINGLAALVEITMQLDPYSGSYFVFCNGSRTLLKILYWDWNGFALWYKRLEKDRFGWPKDAQAVREITAEEFDWLLRGLDFTKAHRATRFTTAIS